MPCGCSIKLEAMEAKQDAVAGQVEGISKELAGQGAKLERLEASCSQLVQVGWGWHVAGRATSSAWERCWRSAGSTHTSWAPTEISDNVAPHLQALRAVASGTAELEKQVQHVLSQRRPVMSGAGASQAECADRWASGCCACETSLS